MTRREQIEEFFNYAFFTAFIVALVICARYGDVIEAAIIVLKH